jgi:hypothetical protein
MKSTVARLATVSLVLLLPAGDAWRAAALETVPADVARFVERRDLCDHFRGEEPYDAARRKFLEAKTREFCAGTDKELARLKARYGTRPDLMGKLNEYEDVIE